MKPIVKRYNLIIIVSFLLVAGFFLTNLISYLSAKESVRNNIINTSLPLTRDNIYSEIQRDIMLPVYVASLMSHDTFLKDWVLNGEQGLEPIKNYLNEIQSKYNFFTTFFVSSETGNYYFNNGLLKVISPEERQDSWYYKFLDKHVPYELNIDANEAENFALTIFINHRVYGYDNNLIGVTGIGLDLDRITNLLSEYRVKYNREIFLIDKKGLVKAHHNKDLVEIANIRLMEGIQEHAEKILEVSHFSDNFEYDRGGKHFLMTKRFIPELNWFLIVEQNQNIAIESIWLNFIKSTFLGLLVSAVVIMIILSAINYYNKRLEKLAVTDDLTGSYNRREFARIFEKAVSWNSKNASPFSVLLIDIDHFKKINDSMGHVIGDRIIKIITDIIHRNIRSHDMMARWGGDEFIMLIYGDLETARSIAERVRAGVEDSPELKEILKENRTTLSMGVTQYLTGDTQDTITMRADSALYKAKDAGRNKVCTA